MDVWHGAIVNAHVLWWLIDSTTARLPLFGKMGHLNICHVNYFKVMPGQESSIKMSYGSGHKRVAVLLPGFAIIW